MGFFFGIENFGSKILGGVMKAAQWVAPALHKVLLTISGPVGMIHPGIGGALSAGANLAGVVDRIKRGNSGQTSANDSLPLVDGTAQAGISNEYSRGDNRYPSKISTTLPEKDSSVGDVGAQTTYVKSDHQHPLQFSSNIPAIDAANGSYCSSTDYALSNYSHPINVETNAGNILKPDGQGDNGTSTFYIKNDHIHPLSVQVLDPLPDGEATTGLANTYVRSDHIHPINVSSTVPIKDTINGVVGTQTTFSCSDHARPLNVIATFPMAESPLDTAGIVGNSAMYARAYHAHPENYNQNQYNVPAVSKAGGGNDCIIATAFIKTDGLPTHVLMGDGHENVLSIFVLWGDSSTRL
ncbi:MAG: hypothetical protein EZS28_012776 [Streblomastix strix]|uniref:Uncharacterized protein n=1 Tax=Streblomastix strix TaxID=222440 RepID=A0A5J4WAL2_9EUKA|nr:MAG: hypothetical protein EZS28_012776 [Streblomastix strix]